SMKIIVKKMKMNWKQKMRIPKKLLILDSRAYTTWGNCSFHITKEEGVLIWPESSINNFFGIFIFCFQFIFIFFTIIFIEPWHDVILYRIWSAFDFSVI